MVETVCIDANEEFVKLLHTMTMFEEPDENVPQETPDLIHLKEALKIHVSYFRWISRQFLTPVIANRTFIKTRKKFSNEKIIAAKDETLKFRTFKTISDLSILAFLSTYFKRFEEAEEFLNVTLEHIDHAIKEGFLNEEHALGIQYVLKGVGFYLQYSGHEITGSHKEFFRYVNEESSNVESLSEKSLGVVFGTKAYFYGKLRIHEFLGPKFPALNRAIHFDPDFNEWHLMLYRLRRYSRKHFYERRTPLEKKEVDEMLRSLELAPDNVPCLLAQLLCLADQHSMKYWYSHKPIDGQNDELVLGTLVFKTNEEIAQFYKKQSKIIIQNGYSILRPSHVRALILLFALSLPNDLQDFAYAREILEKCYQVHPSSRTMETSLGFWYIGAPMGMGRDFQKAKLHLLKALEMDPKHFTTRTELLRLLLNDPLANETEFNELYKSSIKVETMQLDQIAKFLFLNGLFLFALGHLRETMEAWIMSFNLHAQLNTLDFHDIKRCNFRFAWPTTRDLKGCMNALSVWRIAECFKDFRNWEDLSEEMKNDFEKVDELIKKAIETQEEKIENDENE